MYEVRGKREEGRWKRAEGRWKKDDGRGMMQRAGDSCLIQTITIFKKETLGIGTCTTLVQVFLFQAGNKDGEAILPLAFVETVGA